jgi:hypothetical protein
VDEDDLEEVEPGDEGVVIGDERVGEVEGEDYLEGIEEVLLGDEDVEHRHSQLHEEELEGDVGDVCADLQADVADQPDVRQL